MGADAGESGDSDVISQINVTPFVDVVLVLLVVFIATAPILLKETLKIQLPKSAVTDGVSQAVQTLGVAVSAQGEVLLNGKLVSESELGVEVQARVAADPKVQALISADSNARHGDVVRAIGWIKAAGLERFALQVVRDNP